MSEETKAPGIIKIFSSLMLQKVPSYANKIYYSLGFLSMLSFFVSIVSGLIEVFYGPAWWLTTTAGVYVRSVHLWAAQAFVLFILLHLIIVFLTSGYKTPRRLTWVIGALMLFFVLMEAELGYGLRGDFSSQWRVLQASDLYNGSGLGAFVNNLNYAQIYGIHIVLIPLIILGLLFVHYLLVKVRGISAPHRTDTAYRMVRANHRVLFLRGFILLAVILVLAWAFPSPLILPKTIQDVAKEDPALVADTLVKELGHSSDTATYLDNIDPYSYDTAEVYVHVPYEQLRQVSGSADRWTSLLQLSDAARSALIQKADEYFSGGGSLRSYDANQAIAIASALTGMAQSGLYEAALNQQPLGGGDNRTYSTRFLADTGVMDAKAQDLKITTDQYGMVREENGGILPPGAWWLTPLGVMDHTILANDVNQDRDGAEIIGLLFLLLVAFPYIPYLNRLPEKIGLDKFIQKDNGFGK
ncbi:cytochrome b N-terminal domain-containing protein [Patescibacteria group bacterium]|nr:cytochrome b N-terminal domain-containing protein [Patescibacteria group bacterium]